MSATKAAAKAATFKPLPPEALAKLPPEVLEEYEAQLEALFWGRAKASFEAFCQTVEVPGAPSNADETDFFPVHVQPAQHHKLIIDAVQGLAENRYSDIDGIMVFMPPGSAKALALDTPIPTPGGWRRMGDLQVGDKVFDEFGQPCDVTWVSPIWKNRPVYRVTTDCGDVIVADKDHEWLVRLCGKRPVFKIKETWELARDRSKHPMIQRAGALSLPDAALPVDPYLLGVWLGDGHRDGMRITSSVADQPWLRAELARLGYKTVSTTIPTLFAVHGVRAEFVGLGLINDPGHNTHGTKYIPQAYMRASVGQRLALLQGLIDTDGTVCKRKGSVTFCNTNRHLAEQVRELVRSLGVKAGWSESPAMLNGKFCGIAYRVSFYHAQAARLPRKAKLCRNQNRTPHTYIDVKPAGFADTVCIEVNSPSHLFLCGRSMTPTHNSTYTSVLAPAWLLGRKPGTNVIATSYGDDLAQRFGRRVRHIARGESFEKIMQTGMTGDNQDVKDWSLRNGSEYRASGLGGTITGIRADYMFIDDPVKNREEADSEVIRDKRWQAYLDDVQSRLKPGGKIFLIMTRWHEDDLAGRLLGEDWKGQSGLWRCTDGRLFLVINCPLLAEHADDPLGRAPGALLWSEWFRMKDADRMQEAARKGGTMARTWSSLYQQRPAPNEGAILSRSYWNKWEKKIPECEQVYLCYDTAFEEDEENDFSAMTAWGVFEHVSKKSGGFEYNHKHVILLGAWEERINAADLLDAVKFHAQLFKPDRILVEKRASGIQLIQEMQRLRLPVKAWLPPGKPGAKGKIPRAHAVASMLEQGSVHYVSGKRTERVLDQCAAFPYGKNDDLVDTVTMALSYFRNKFIFQTADDELDKAELDEAMIRHTEQRRQRRVLYSGVPTRSRDDDDDFGATRNMTDATRRRIYGG